MSIAENIYRIMENKNQKQCGVAVAAGYSIRGFNDMLRGRKVIRAEDVPNICRGLGVSPNDLFNWGIVKTEENDKAG